ncbi:MAG: gliding motility lipoprotein GldD [Bacteroidales bacterium]|nr:gliding motility lipoprotein GldD [Bacteroidales bacterium]
MRTRQYHMILLLLMLLALACQRSYTPKPRGFLRIDFPAREYVLFDSVCPYTFEYPSYGKIVPDTDYLTEPCWINIDFPDFDGIIHISYKEVNQNLNDFIEDSRALTYKHTIKADAIKETVYSNPELEVHGILYDIKGNAASSIQFYLTDSNAHFLRGSLYFNVQPDKDSLAPVISFFREDIIHLVESFAWK